MSEMIIKASVSYQATVDSVIWKGYDALTREYCLKDRWMLRSPPAAILITPWR